MKPLPQIHGLFHVAIKTANLARTKAFYLGVLGMRDQLRPDFGTPGAWIGLGDPGTQPIIHIFAGADGLAPDGSEVSGTASVDHLSLSCSGYASYIQRFDSYGLDWRTTVVPGTTLWQLFVYDPSGLLVELTFDGRLEGDAKPNTSPSRAYVPNKPFFAGANYPKLESIPGD